MNYFKKFLILLFIIFIALVVKYYGDYSFSSDVEVNGKFIASFIDVGQGDSIFLEFPNGKNMLIDAGENYESETVQSFINSKGYFSLDYVVGTHPHTDHIGGLESIIRRYEIGEIYLPKVVHTSKTYENLLTTINELGYKVNSAISGMEIINEKGLEVKILSPKNSNYSELNNYSVVIKIVFGNTSFLFMVFGNTSFLFMGDAETVVEDEILDEVNADVVKVGHHGSDTSSSEEFVKSVNAKYAVIMSGFDNQYDLPDKAIVDRWKSNGAEVYNTSENGNVIITSDGRNITVEVEHESYN